MRSAAAYPPFAKTAKSEALPFVVLSAKPKARATVRDPPVPIERTVTTAIEASLASRETRYSFFVDERQPGVDRRIQLRVAFLGRKRRVQKDLQFPDAVHES
jgi:hypothetical protein